MDINKMIERYFDGELESSEEKELFIILSANDEARNYFKQNHLLSSLAGEMQEEFPQELEKKILSGTILTERRNFFGQKIRPLLVYASVAVFFLLSIFFYNEANGYRENIAKINNRIENQDRTIKRLLNSLPAAEVEAKFSNEIIIRAN